ncbi:OLC1v1036955C2 [Oldenlandia corymbosa var. corymbosa]|uniref:OLC1v1036955C2 n=1 Tax=Oldenlandia corymbosa var. corymbosa TaxID=529605 RepID=A0AAV1CZT0_OLDCO|nr:OLC1v1036955C2 [Oldenlandia corymbosa var. corymbosa]
MVTLRILEGLSTEEIRIRNNETSLQGQNPELEASNSREDVLRLILEEMSAADPKLVGPDMQNWDIQSFIVHKRTSFPLRALQKLKEAILEGGHSVLASLKERSGLAINPQNDNKADDEESDDDLRDRHSVPPAETSAAATSDENCRLQTSEDQITSDDDSSEKVEQDSNISKGFAVENSIVLPLHWQSTNASDGIIQCTGEDKFPAQNEVDVGPFSVQNRNDRLEENSEDINLLPGQKNCAATSENLKRLSYEGKQALDVGDDSQVGEDFVKENRVDSQINSPSYAQSLNSSQQSLPCSEKQAQNLLQVNKFGSSVPQNEDGEFQRTAQKRNRTIVPVEDLGDSFETHAEVSKKYKQDTNVSGGNVAENTACSPMHGISTIPSYMNCNLHKEGCIGPVDGDGSFHDSVCRNAEPKRLAQSCDADEHLPIPMEIEVELDVNKTAEFPAASSGQQNILNEPKGRRGFLEQRTLNQISSGGLEKETQPENATYLSEGNLLRKPSNYGEGKDDVVYSPNLEKTNDSDECNDERIAAALKKDNQDSYATQSNSCIKCDGDGELLVCSSSTCQLMVHRSCLRSAGMFDENGKFYCPFCAYSRSISEYLQIKKKAALARKDLAMFIGMKTDCQPEKSSSRTEGAMLGQLRRNGEIGIDNEENDEELINRATKSQCMQDRHQTEPPQNSNVDNCLRGKRMVLTNGTASVSAKRNLEKEDLGQQLGASELVRTSDNVRIRSNSIGRNKRNKEMHVKKIRDTSKVTLPFEPLSPSNNKSSKDDHEKCATSRYSMRSRNQVIQYTDLVIPQLRRKPLPWSKEEEEILKVGVRKLTTIHDKKIPWMKILEFGADVFEKGRSAVDLKDKWRNICKGSPVSQ